MYLQVLAYIIPAKILRTRILVIATHRFENTRASRAEIICAEVIVVAHYRCKPARARYTGVICARLTVIADNGQMHA